MTPEQMGTVLEAALLAAGRALSIDEMVTLFEGHEEAPDRELIRAGLSSLETALADRSVELVRVASGYRLQVRAEYSRWLAGLFAERPPRYSRALLETLALIAYRQPITRGEIEEVRGVAVSTSIVKTLMDREWIRTLGHREVPGRPALYGTTRAFLDHFGLKSLDGLPALAELKDLDRAEQDLFASMPVGADPGSAAASAYVAADDDADDPGDGQRAGSEPAEADVTGDASFDLGGAHDAAEPVSPDPGSPDHDPPDRPPDTSRTPA